MTNTLLSILSFLLSFPLLALPIRGTVKDVSGAPLAGATVVVDDVRSTRTDSAGTFGFDLPAGTWLTGRNARGPLLFCLLLSLFLSLRAASDQKQIVFSGVFAIIWFGEAVVTMQIKLLGGTM